MMMISEEAKKHIRQLEIQVKRLLRGALVGQNSAAVKGSGFEFDQIREYQPGDDVRFIDWKSSARTQKLMTRQYIEERRRTIILMVDISASIFFGSGKSTKYAHIAEIAAVLALVADLAKDRVGLLLFAQEVELFIPPCSGQKQIHLLLEQLFSVKPKKEGTSIEAALAYVARLPLKDAIVFLISDFISAPFQHALAVVAKKYECIAIRCLDQREVAFVPVGFLSVVDQESGVEGMIRVKKKDGAVNHFLSLRLHEQNRLFKKYAVDMLQVETEKSYMKQMVRFFQKRLLY